METSVEEAYPKSKTVLQTRSENKHQETLRCGPLLIVTTITATITTVTQHHHPCPAPNRTGARHPPPPSPTSTPTPPDRALSVRQRRNHKPGNDRPSSPRAQPKIGTTTPYVGRHHRSPPSWSWACLVRHSWIVADTPDVDHRNKQPWGKGSLGSGVVTPIHGRRSRG